METPEQARAERVKTPGLRLARSLGQTVFIEHIPTHYTLEVIVKEIKKPESVTLELYGRGNCGRWYIGEVKLESDEDLELVEGLTARIHDFRSDSKVCIQYIGPKEKYTILRSEIVRKPTL